MSQCTTHRTQVELEIALLTTRGTVIDRKNRAITIPAKVGEFTIVEDN